MATHAERQPIRQVREAKIRAGAILETDTPERVRKRNENVAIETEGIGLPNPGQASGPAEDDDATDSIDTIEVASPKQMEEVARTAEDHARRWSS